MHNVILQKTNARQYQSNNHKGLKYTAINSLLVKRPWLIL